MQPPAREQLEIVWRGEQAPGISFYALFARGSGKEDALPEDLWPTGVVVGVSTLHNGRWEVLVWDVAISAWPTGDAWVRSLHGSLGSLTDAGARVAWIGREGFFCDPPDLFEPACMSGGVLAAATPEGGPLGTLDPDLPLVPLTDEDLLTLREASGGLSDV